MNRISTVRILSIVAACVTSLGSASAQGVILTPGTVVTYHFDASTPSEVHEHDPPCGGHGYGYYGRITVLRPYSNPVQGVIRAELFEDPSSLSPILVFDHEFVAFIDPWKPDTAFSLSGAGPGWADHEGVVRLTYVKGTPLELTWFQIEVLEEKTVGGRLTCNKVVFLVPEHGGFPLFLIGSLLTVIFARERTGNSECGRRGRALSGRA